MMSREKDRTKQIQDRCQMLLTQMLRDDDNKYCVDCDAKGPRWASWNIGIFLCIRCAGIHRNLGVHISKVKSVNLDSWTPEQVVSLQQMGNSRARAVFEANLPDSFRRPQTDSALESFIRAKYETKKYIAEEWVQPPLPKVNWDKELDEENEKLRKKKKETKTPVAVPVPKKIEVVPQLPKPIATASASAKAQPSADLLGLETPQDESKDDAFSSFLSAEPATKRTEEEESFFNQTPTTNSQANNGKLTTDSILALYKNQNQNQYYPNPNFQQPQATFQQPNVSNPFYRMNVQQSNLTQDLSSLSLNGGICPRNDHQIPPNMWQ